MKLTGNKFAGNALLLAFQRSGYKLREKRASWPRLKGPVGIRVEVKTGFAVAMIRKEKRNVD